MQRAQSPGSLMRNMYRPRWKAAGVTESQQIQEVQICDFRCSFTHTPTHRVVHALCLASIPGARQRRPQSLFSWTKLGTQGGYHQR